MSAATDDHRLRRLGRLTGFFGLPVGLLRRLRGLSWTIRGKLLVAFGALAAITFSLGVAGTHSVGTTGDLVVENLDQPLASISYARFGLAKFTAMQSMLARRQVTARDDQRTEIDRRMNRLAQETGTYLKLAASRATSARTIAAAREAAANVALWDAQRRISVSHNLRSQDHEDLTRLGAIILADFEHLVELTAEDGLGARQRALSAITEYRRLTLLATLVALLIGGAIAYLLGRSMTRPIAEASRAAHRIASGELDVPIAGLDREDELGALLAAMAVMRDNIRAMMEREVAAKRAAQNDLAAAIDSAPAAMILVDGEGRVSATNSQAHDFFPDHAEMLTTGEVFSRHLANAFNEPSGELRLDDGRWLKLVRRTTEDGGFVAVASDITVLKARETALIAARDVAEAASRAKTDFLANMSHELRTPLNAVIGFSEMIASEMLGPVGQPKYKEFAGDILFSGRHLLQIINHVLDIAKLQWGRMEIDRVPTDLGGVVAEAVRIARAQAQAGGIALEMEMVGAVPSIAGDQVRLRQVVLNLLSNAIKFTPAGGRVEVTLRRRGIAVEIAVRDTGIGMKASDIPKALEPFQQANSSIARKYGGTGLGLPLCKLFVELHDGTFAIASAPGQGTTVTVTLPLTRGAEHARDLVATE
ncbi:MAG TPA: ATP-binding protein [Stellaceae bacterium]|jgi:signal transduction histidine kinase|nr:ATP-binding protein [Stellaceae bacterium]